MANSRTAKIYLRKSILLFFMMLLLMVFLLLKQGFGQDAKPTQPALKNSLFIRVYDRSGHKINKGVLLVVTDTTLQLKGKVTTRTIPLHEIGYIKTKRSDGHNVLIGSVIGMSIMVIFGATDQQKGLFTRDEKMAFGAIAGLPMGAALGGISILFKSSKTYHVNGDPVSWNKFKMSVH